LSVKELWATPSAKHDANVAVRGARAARDDAEFAIDFAYGAIEEAEYAVLDAALTRMDSESAATSVPS
jgi:hypothetical protein